MEQLSIIGSLTPSSADLWCNWLAERGQRRARVGALGFDEKLGYTIILAARRNAKISVNARRCKRCKGFDIAHQFEAWHISPRPRITGEGMYSLISQYMERELAGEGVIVAFHLHALHFWHDRHF